MDNLTMLSSITSNLQRQVSTIERYMQSENISMPTFDAESPVVFDLPLAEEQARQNALDCIDQLHAMLLGPLPYLMRILSPAVNIFNALHAIYRFNIAQHLGIEEVVSYEALAERCNLNIADLKRFLRMAIAYRIFLEPRKGMVQHNSVSKALACTPGFHDWVGMVCEEMWPASMNCVPAMLKWDGSTEIAHTGFTLTNGNDTPFFEFIGNDPRRALRFAAAMKVVHSAPTMDLGLLADGLGWTAGTCPKRVVDIGGSSGALGKYLLTKFPQIEEYVVEDFPDVINGADADVPAELDGRLKFTEYNFLEKQKIEGADCYILRLILHDWPDKYAMTILRNQILALKPGTTIVINEICLPDPGILTNYQEQFLRGFDLSMKHINNGKERSHEDWTALVEKTDKRFCIKRIITPPGSLLSVIEIVFDSPVGSDAVEQVPV